MSECIIKIKSIKTTELKSPASAKQRGFKGYQLQA